MNINADLRIDFKKFTVEKRSVWGIDSLVHPLLVYFNLIMSWILDKSLIVSHRCNAHEGTCLFFTLSTIDIIT